MVLSVCLFGCDRVVWTLLANDALPVLITSQGLTLQTSRCLSYFSLDLTEKPLKVCSTIFTLHILKVDYRNVVRNAQAKVHAQRNVENLHLTNPTNYLLLV